MSKGVLYLPIEIKQREYDAQIFFSLKAAERGYTVFLGTHEAIYSLLRLNRSRNGLFLDKSLPNESRLKWLQKRCSYVWVLDAEVSPIHTSEVLQIELKSRVYEEGIKKIDKFLVVGEMAEKAAISLFGTESNKVLKSGWPRIDIAGNLGAEIYKKEISKIKSKHQSFFLFVSSFGSNRDPNEIQGQRRATVYESTPLWGGEQTAQDIYLKFLFTVECLRAWDADPRVPRIIVRPHVGELKSVWRESLKGLTKTFIEDEGNAAPWIYASEGVIHQGSTISFQSYLAGKENMFFKSGALIEFSKIAEKMSEFVISQELKPVLQKDRISDHQNPKFNPEVIDRAIFNPEGGSSNFILDQIDILDLGNVVEASSVKIVASQFRLSKIRRVIGLIRDEIYWKAKLISIHPQSISIPGGLGKKEINRMSRILDNVEKLEIKRKTLNLWKIAPK